MLDFTQLHFIRPYFLLGIIILPVLCLLLVKIRRQQTAWRNLLPAHLQQHQIKESTKSSSVLAYWLLAFVWILSSLGLAGPSWEKLPQPVYQTQVGKVLILDMSMSMRATDIPPDRLTRARFKSLDLLESIKEGEIGLVAYAGDAFVISPLTDDIANLQNLIPSLSPEIMPVRGSNPLAAFDKAKQLLVNAGYQEGEIYWITDGIGYEDITLLQEELTNTPYKVSALLVGTRDGAPIKMIDGSLLKDATGKIVIPRVSENYLHQALGSVGGKVTRMTTTISDIENMVMKSNPMTINSQETEELSTGDVWEDMGVFIAISLLPFVAYFFRKGLFICIFIGILYPPNDVVYAQEAQANTATNDKSLNNSPNTDSTELSFFNKLFLNNDQKGEIAYAQQDYSSAQNTFEDPNWKAASAYKSGNYEKALELYESLNSDAVTPEQNIANQYNKANTLAKLSRLEEALDAYRAVLEASPDHKDAIKNKAIVEAMLQQQEQNQENGGEKQEDNSQQEGDNQQENNQQQNTEQEQGQQSEQEQQSGEQQSQEGQQNQAEESQSEQQNEQNSAKQEGKESNSEDKQQEQSNEQQSGTTEQNAGEQDSNAQDPVEENPQSVIEGQINPEDLSPEEREQLQKMQMLMNKVPDDPAFLLKRKMLLESRARQQNRTSVLQQQTW